MVSFSAGMLHGAGSDGDRTAVRIIIASHDEL